MINYVKKYHASFHPTIMSAFGGISLKCKRKTLNDKDKLIKRLNIIEGQVKGLQTMIGTEQSCIDVLMQLTAIRAALSKVGDLFLKEYTSCFIMNANASKEDLSIDVLEQFINHIQKYSK